MEDEPWHVKRRRELLAAAPVKRRREVKPFVKVPLWWIAAATEKTNMLGALVLIELLYASWKAKSLTFPLSNTRLAEWGVSRDVKRRVLRDLEQGGLILVERFPGQSPRVTLIGL
jgi:hypothetical protein